MGQGYIRADGHQVGSILVEPKEIGGQGKKLPTIVFSFPVKCLQSFSRERRERQQDPARGLRDDELPPEFEK